MAETVENLGVEVETTAWLQTGQDYCRLHNCVLAIIWKWQQFENEEPVWIHVFLFKEILNKNNHLLLHQKYKIWLPLKYYYIEQSN